VSPARTRATDAVLHRASSALAELASVDQAVYAAIAGTDTPTLDRVMRRLSGAADYSKLSLAASVVLALGGGVRGRRAAISGLTSVAVTATVVNTVIKPLGRRRRPDRASEEVPVDRHVRMPGSRSFPSGHTAAAVAFAHGVARVMPWAGVPLYALAAAVGYSRVHTGVHYPGDVLGGAVLGAMISDATAGSFARRADGHSSASKS
jgi:membrane-associated phospholipid phosphatase